MIRDIVCGMEIDSAKAKHKLTYRGKIYYFCSSACMEEFKKNPEHYLGGEHTGAYKEHRESRDNRHYQFHGMHQCCH